jgi:dCMP deaminase
MHSAHSEASKAIVAYVPALHAGYLSFFGKHPGSPIFILGRTFIDDYPRLNRDIRALEPENAAKALIALGFDASVIEIDATDHLSGFRSIVLPDEDVSRDFANKYVKPDQVSLESIFLRWDGVFAGKEAPPNPDRVISDNEFDREIMAEARAEGEKSADWWRQIGAVLVKDGAIVALGHTRYFPSDLALDIFGTPRTTVDAGERPDLYISMHAEADLVAQAAHLGIPLQGASLYVSTFPCINCAFLIARSGIKVVYYDEGYSRIDAEGVLKGAGVEIVQVSKQP